LKENKRYVFSIAKLFFLFYRTRNTYERNESHSLENCHVKILVLEFENGNKNYESESESEKNELGSTTLI
jgi:hypothetical protein